MPTPVEHLRARLAARYAAAGLPPPTFSDAQLDAAILVGLASYGRRQAETREAVAAPLRKRRRKPRPINVNVAMPATPGPVFHLPESTQIPAPIVNVTVPEQPAPVVNVNVPEQPAPVVNVAAPALPAPVVNVPRQDAPIVNVTVPQQPAPVVNVEAPQVTVEAPPPRAVTKRVYRDRQGNIERIEETEE